MSFIFWLHESSHSWAVPFYKFSNENNKIIKEHISMILAQLSEASHMWIYNFPLSLDGTTFSWFCSSQPFCISSWLQLEEKVSWTFFTIKLMSLNCLIWHRLSKHRREESVFITLKDSNILKPDVSVWQFRHLLGENQQMCSLFLAAWKIIDLSIVFLTAWKIIDLPIVSLELLAEDVLIYFTEEKNNCSSCVLICT